MAGHRDLVAREDGNAAPGGHRVPADLRRLRVDAALGALAAERRDGPRVGEEESGSFHTLASSSSMSSGVGGPVLVCSRWERSALCSRPMSGLLMSSCFLALAQGLDGQAELVLDLVHRVVVQVGDPGVDLQHGLRDAQLVFPRGQPRSRRTYRAARTRPRGRRRPRSRPRRARSAARGRWARRPAAAAAARTAGPAAAGPGAAREHDAGRGRHGGELPAGVVARLHHLLAEVLAVGQGAEHGLVAVLPDADLGDLAVRDQESRSAGCPASTIASPSR